MILATGFIHLLEPSVDALGEGNTLSAGGCIPDSWAAYPYPFALCLASLFATFVSQIVFFRLGTERMHRLVGGRGGARPHIHVVGHPGHVDAPPPPPREERPTSSSSGGSGSDVEKAAAGGTDDKSALERASYTDAMEDNPVAAQVRFFFPSLFALGLEDSAADRARATHSSWASSRSSSASSSTLCVLLSPLPFAPAAPSSSSPRARTDLPPSSLSAAARHKKVIIGLTLATTSDDEVTTLFIVIVFHRTLRPPPPPPLTFPSQAPANPASRTSPRALAEMFEGLGLGSRLAFLRLDDDDDEESGRTVTAARLLPWLGALLYSLCTPVGMAIGLGLREGIVRPSFACFAVDEDEGRGTDSADGPTG